MRGIILSKQIERHAPDAKQINFFSFLCAAIYFTCYLNRYNYGAAISEIIRDTGSTKSVVSLAVTLCFISYGMGQLLSGFLGDRLSPRFMVFGGLGISSLCNCFIALFPRIEVMTFIWLFNGFAQSMIWPPLVRIMSEYMNTVQYKRAAAFVTVASNCSTIVIYLMVPACIRVSGWRLAFALPAAVGIIMAFFWLFYVTRLENTTAKITRETASGNTADNVTKVSMRSLIISAGLIPMMAAIVLQGILRDGVSTWTPTLITEVFHLDTSVSILTSVVLPIVSVCSTLIAGAVDRKIKNETLTSAIFFGAALMSAALLIPLYTISPLISVLLLAVLTGTMHGINLMLISNVCGQFAAYGRASSVSGLMNAFTYAGSALSTYGVAALSTRWGWQKTIFIWLAVAALGGICCLSVAKRWKKFLLRLSSN